MIAVATSPQPECYLGISADLAAAMGYQPAHLSGHLVVHHLIDGTLHQQTAPILVVPDPAFDNMIESHQAARQQRAAAPSNCRQ